MPGTYDIRCVKGETFVLPLTWKDRYKVPIDITGYSAKLAVIRYNSDSSPILELTSPSDIAIDGVNGKITVTITHTVSADLPAGNWKYDLVIAQPLPTGKVTRLLRGAFIVEEDVATDITVPAAPITP